MGLEDTVKKLLRKYVPIAGALAFYGIIGLSALDIYIASPLFNPRPIKTSARNPDSEISSQRFIRHTNKFEAGFTINEYISDTGLELVTKEGIPNQIIEMELTSPDSNEKSSITFSNKKICGQLALSPDAKQVAFCLMYNNWQQSSPDNEHLRTQKEIAGTDVYIMGIDCGGLRNVTNRNGSDLLAGWSDNNTLVVSSDLESLMYGNNDYYKLDVSTNRWQRITFATELEEEWYLGFIKKPAYLSIALFALLLPGAYYFTKLKKTGKSKQFYRPKKTVASMLLSSLDWMIEHPSVTSFAATAFLGYHFYTGVKLGSPMINSPFGPQICLYLCASLLPAFALSYQAISVFGLVHKPRLINWLVFIRNALNMLSANKQKKADAAKKIIDIIEVDTYQVKSFRGNYYAMTGQFERAIVEYDRAYKEMIESLTSRINMPNIMRVPLRWLKGPLSWYSDKQAIRKNPEDIVSLLSLQFSYVSQIGPDNNLVIEIGKKIAAIECEWRDELNVLQAKVFKAIDEPEMAQEQLLRAAKLVRKNPVTRYERQGETRCKGYLVKGRRFLENIFFFKERESMEELSEEMKTARLIDIIFGVHKKYRAAKPLGIIDEPIDGCYSYVMEYANGETLLERMNRKEDVSGNLEDIVRCIALIHVRFPAKMVRGGRIPLAYTLRKKVRDRHVGLPAPLIREFIKSYRPVYDCLSKAVFVYNKDAHPENWLITKEGNIVVLDCEDTWLVPRQFDLVNLMEYNSYLTNQQKDRLIEIYVQEYNRLAGWEKTENLSAFRTGYFNSVIHRAIAFCSAWSSPERESMRSQRAVVIDNALHAITRIREEHIEYFRKYITDYCGLYGALIQWDSIITGS